jgi:hypothetical protein
MTQPRHISDFHPATRWAQFPGFAIACTPEGRTYRVGPEGVRELVFTESRPNPPATNTGD